VERWARADFPFSVIILAIETRWEIFVALNKPKKGFGRRCVWFLMSPALADAVERGWHDLADFCRVRIACWVIPCLLGESTITTLQDFYCRVITVIVWECLALGRRWWRCWPYGRYLQSIPDSVLPSCQDYQASR